MIDYENQIKRSIELSNRIAVKIYQKDLLDKIFQNIIELDPEDATGHIYWNQFLELVKNFKP
jgi:hypothetical protein